MSTEVSIDGTRFLLNGSPTYEGVSDRGRPIEGLLFNSRMVQAIFDDENPETAVHWRYPDTGVWDPDRNTDEFCAMLPEYRRYGLLGVTVGLQGGGSIYVPEVYDAYVNSAFTPEGELKPAYCDRLRASSPPRMPRGWSSSSTTSTGSRHRRWTARPPSSAPPRLRPSGCSRRATATSSSTSTTSSPRARA
jgi:hypothetical protein